MIFILSRRVLTQEEIKPITSFLVPIFFVLMDVQTSSSFAKPGVFALSVGLLLAAIIGEAALLECSIKRLIASQSLWTLPRGEVGLIFASIGQGSAQKGQAMIDPNTFSSIVIVVIDDDDYAALIEMGLTASKKKRREACRQDV